MSLYRKLPLSRCIYRYFLLTCILPSIVILYVLFHFKFFCLSVHAKQKVDQICKSLHKKDSTGNLCLPLCVKEEINSVSCYSFKSTKRVKFKAEWKGTGIIFKSPTRITPFHWYENGKKIYPSEKQFLTALRAVVKNQLNLNLPVNTILRIMKKTIHSKDSDVLKQEEIDALSTLVQDNEFLVLSFFHGNDVFPRLIGTCGSHYATEYVEPLQVTSSLMALTDNVEEWIQRLQMAAQILELLKKLETDFQEPIHLCDIQLHHFGTHKEDESLRYMDLSKIYPKSIINRLFRNLTCQSDEDCEFYDCRSKCNRFSKTCAQGVTNNNFQVTCEKIFLGWRRSNTLIVPGLLLSEHTPSDLAAVLRHCSNPENGTGKPRRAPDANSVKRMHELIVEIEQTFVSRIIP
ncbi:divergent protein kinase domain 1C [Harmonia axyridis]|uniref:divergent protein kinase domain 1C n=1 Tax=Harmonia axyridis TaxID=115357 RepID=UPI001E276197|nr:divergent protein kinase domain 1C [Harmonia axyridis]